MSAAEAPLPPDEALVALGGNLGDVRAAFAGALRGLAALGEVRSVSRVYRTPPRGGPPGQPDHCNAAVRLRTGLSPEALLAALHRLEDAAGRVRAVRWDARTLDLDLIAHGTRVQAGPPTLPHPRALERAFVLLPLRDVCPGWRHPGGIDLAAALRGVRDQVGEIGLADWELE